MFWYDVFFWVVFGVIYKFWRWLEFFLCEVRVGGGGNSVEDRDGYLFV